MDNNFHIFPSETFIDLCLYQYGHEKCTPGHLFGPATRNHYLFHYVLFRNRHPDGHEFQGAECKLSGSERTGIYDFSRTDHHLCGRYSGAMGIRLGGV